MAKLNRIFQKVFGTNGPTADFGTFGSLAAGSPATTKDPDTIQSLSQFLDGWQSAVVGNNSPALQDMNSLFFLAYRQMAYLFQQGIAEWDTSTEYHLGSLVNSDGKVYMSLANTNTGNALTDGTKWTWIAGQSVVSKTADDTGYSAVAGDVILFDPGTGTTPGDSTVALPTAANSKGARITLKKIDSSVYTVSFTGGTVDGETGLTLTEQYESATIVCDGTNWYRI